MDAFGKAIDFEIRKMQMPYLASDGSICTVVLMLLNVSYKTRPVY